MCNALITGHLTLYLARELASQPDRHLDNSTSYTCCMRVWQWFALLAGEPCRAII